MLFCPFNMIFFPTNSSQCFVLAIIYPKTIEFSINGRNTVSSKPGTILCKPRYFARTALTILDQSSLSWKRFCSETLLVRWKEVSKKYKLLPLCKSLERSQFAWGPKSISVLWTQIDNLLRANCILVIQCFNWSRPSWEHTNVDRCGFFESWL